MPRRTAASRSVEAHDEIDLDVDVMDASDLDGAIEIGADAEFIEPRQDLRRKAKPRPSHAGDIEPVAAAEAAVAGMAQRFDGWMAEETTRLALLFARAEETAFDVDELVAFHRAAHDIKGQAATLGFPLAGRIAASLCRLVDGSLETGRIPRELVLQHVQSVRAIIAEQARDETSRTARRLAERLDEVTSDYLRQLEDAA